MHEKMQNLISLTKKFSINKSSRLPYYYQLKQYIIGEIERGNWKPGQQILPEIKICEVFDISRTVVRQTYQELVNEASLINQITSNEEEFSFSGHEKLIPESVLRGGNYASYLKLKQFDNRGDYAKAKHISYEAAKSVSKKTIRNLKAEILLALGWQASPDILDYRQYKSIQSFIRKLLAAINGTGKGLADLRKLHPALPEALEGYKSVDDWGITMLGGRRFRLYLMHL